MTINNTQLKIAIVDDHKVVADGFERLVNESDMAQVVGKVHSAADCMRMLAGEQVDVLLLDISLPDGNGVDLCLQIKAKYPALKILMLTSYSEMTIIIRALENGASGYILKNAMTEEILEGIRVVASGEQFLCEEVDMLMKKKENHPIRLSRREQELLRLIVEGRSNSEIAESMCLGYETIKSYRKNLILKLNAHNTAALVKMAIEQKLVF
jgi:DNA-binding NarL/FixJ family response regulator